MFNQTNNNQEAMPSQESTQKHPFFQTSLSKNQIRGFIVVLIIALVFFISVFVIKVLLPQPPKPQDPILELPEFNQEIALPKNIIVTNNSFDSENNDTYFQAKNTLFTVIKNFYQERNNALFDKNDKSQKYYYPQIIGKLESDKNSNNTNILLELKNNPSFDTLTIKNFSFQIQLKWKDKIVNKKMPITYQKPINLIISKTKFLEKLKKKI